MSLTQGTNLRWKRNRKNWEAVLLIFNFARDGMVWKLLRKALNSKYFFKCCWIAWWHSRWDYNNNDHLIIDQDQDQNMIFDDGFHCRRSKSRALPDQVFFWRCHSFFWRWHSFFWRCHSCCRWRWKGWNDAGNLSQKIYTGCFFFFTGTPLKSKSMENLG